MELSLHPPLMEFRDEGQSRRRLQEAVDAARECGFAALSANDHFLFSTPWLDGPTALASVIERSGDMELSTTVSLAVLRGPVPLAKTLAALDVLSDGRLIAGVGPGSSARDFEAIGVPFEERWKRFEESVTVLRALLRGEALRHGRTSTLCQTARWSRLRAGGAEFLCGSEAGARKQAFAAWPGSPTDGLPPPTTQRRSASSPHVISSRGSSVDGDAREASSRTRWSRCGHGSATAGQTPSALRTVLAPLLRREPDELREQVCVGPPEHCAQLLSRYAAAGCQRVHLWPLGDERHQIERVAAEVAPLI